MEASKQPSAGGSGCAQQRYSWAAPKVIVVLDETDILEESNCITNGVNASEQCLVRATHLSESTNDGLREPLMPATEAYPVAAISITSTPSALSPHLVETGEAMPLGHLRPEYIYVKVIKDGPTAQVGIVLRQKKDKVFISRIKRGSLLSSSLLRQGDHILAINGVSCIRLTATKVASLIRNSKKSVSIVVWNKAGDPNLVSCTVQKPTRSSKVGVCIKNDHGAVRVCRVHPDGLFAGSLIMPGHRCIEINGVRCDGLRSKDAASMISFCDEFVTIISRPRQECAIVLSCEVHKSWLKSVACFLAAGPVSVVTSQSLHV